MPSFDPNNDVWKNTNFKISLSDYKSMKASWLLGLVCILLLTSRRCPSGASCRGHDAAEKKKKEEEELTMVVDEGT